MPGLMNNHQVLPGARRPGQAVPYVLAGITKTPTATLAGTTVTFTGGVIEFDGFSYPLGGSLNFATIPTALLKNGACYNIYAVPRYLEPPTRAAAEAAGVNYYTYTSNGDTYADFFLPSVVEATITAAGGVNELWERIANGVATDAERAAYDAYTVALQDNNNPALVGNALPIVGVDFVIAESVDQDNRPQRDALSGLTGPEIKVLMATQTNSTAVLRPNTVPITAPGTFAGPVPLEKVKTLVLYPTAADATAMTNGYTVTYPSAESLREAYEFATRPITPAEPPNICEDCDDVIGLGWTAVFARYWEYLIPTNLQRGQWGNQDKIITWYTKDQVQTLGRVNPIYMAPAFQPARICLPMPRRGRLTYYACPTLLARVCDMAAGVPGQLQERYEHFFDGTSINP
jgi:hypothetical protein